MIHKFTSLHRHYYSNSHIFQQESIAQLLSIWDINSKSFIDLIKIGKQEELLVSPPIKNSKKFLAKRL